MVTAYKITLLETESDKHIDFNVVSDFYINFDEFKLSERCYLCIISIKHNDALCSYGYHAWQYKKNISGFLFLDLFGADIRF